jgi:hypothetical protein
MAQGGGSNNGHSNPFAFSDPPEPRPRDPAEPEQDDDQLDPEDEKTGPTYPPDEEVQDLWDACLPVTDLPFIRERRWDVDQLRKLDVVRLTPEPDDYDWPVWWARGRAKTWRLVTRAFSTNGQLRSLHARAIAPVEKGTPKTLWPKGFDATSLVMPDRAGLELLQARSKPRVLLVAEGLTDLVALSLKVAVLPDAAVLSCTNGCFPALRTIAQHLSIWTDVYSATDHDEPGDRYTREIATALAPLRVKRLPATPPPARPPAQAAHR